MTTLRHSERTRFDQLRREISDSDTVINVGAGGPDTRENSGALHEFLVETGAAVVGVEIDSDAVTELQDAGYDVREGDAQELSELDISSADAVVAGELIEHLDNPGEFLREAHAVTSDEGVLKLSTPNPMALIYTFKSMLGKKNSPYHTCWFDPQTISQLAERCGWKLTDVEWVPADGGVSSLLHSLAPQVTAPKFVATFEKEAR